MNPYILKATPLPDYLMQVEFENGEIKFFDVKPYLEIGVFKKLKELKRFNTVRVVAGSIEWDGEIDLSYDTVYLEEKLWRK